MTTTVYSNVWNPRQGGGMAYILGVALALSERDEVRLLFPTRISRESVTRLFPIPIDGLDLGTAPKIRFALGRELLNLVSNGRVVIQATEVPRLKGIWNAHLVCEFPFQRRLGPGSRLRLAAFRSIVANSAYTATWIERRWGRRAQVLHPPVFPIPVREKKPWIVALGRFTDGGRSKRQLEMVRTFRRMVEEGLDGWELHLVGTAQTPEYAFQVAQEGEGLPVVLHLDASREELEAVCGAASLFWHFTGAGEDPETAPERMEHFGIATVEAMSAGAVPVVVARGGQPEIVQEGTGLLWSTFEECAESTLRLCRDGELRARLAEGARRRAGDFAWPAFAERARELLA